MAEWRTHNGRGCPTHEDAIVLYVMRGADKHIRARFEIEAGKLRWKHRGDIGDITHFRVTAPPTDRAL
jgi:hypothetical protein